MNTYIKNGGIRFFGFKSQIVPTLVIISLLMLPYFRPLHCDLGMLAVAVWALCNLAKLKAAFFVAAFAVILSNINGCMFFNTGFNGLINGAMILYAFILYYFLKSANIAKSSAIKSILLLYLFVVLLMSIVFSISPEKYFLLRSFFSMKGQVIEFGSLIINRFTFIFSDPNNAGCFFVALLAYLLVYERLNTLEIIFCVLVSALAVLFTSSVSASINFVLFLICFCFMKPANKAQKLGRQIVIKILLICLLFVALPCAHTLAQSESWQVLTERHKINSSNGMGGRLEKWQEVLTVFNPLSFVLVGRGLPIERSGFIHAPHNGILYIFYSYGLFTLLARCITFYKKLNSKLVCYLPLLPIALNFIVNIGIQDYRLLTAETLIISLMHCAVQNKNILYSSTKQAA